MHRGEEQATAASGRASASVRQRKGPRPRLVPGRWGGWPPRRTAESRSLLRRPAAPQQESLKSLPAGGASCWMEGAEGPLGQAHRSLAAAHPGRHCMTDWRQ